MTFLRDTVLRLLLLCIAFGLPLLPVILLTGKAPPITLDPAVLDDWSPIDAPGPSTSLLARGITWLVGAGTDEVPDWFSPDDQATLVQARLAFENDRLRQALGHLLVLSERIEEQGKSMSDFLPVVMPDLVTWVVANYFAPVLLGTILVVIVLLIFGPWLMRRFFDFIKLFLTMIVGLAGIIAAVALCLTIAQEKSLVFALVEYLVAVASILALGNFFVFWKERTRTRAARGDAVAAGEDRLEPRMELVARRDPPAGTEAATPKPTLRAVRTESPASDSESTIADRPVRPLTAVAGSNA